MSSRRPQPRLRPGEPIDRARGQGDRAQGDRGRRARDTHVRTRAHAGPEQRGGYVQPGRGAG